MFINQIGISLPHELRACVWEWATSDSYMLRRRGCDYRGDTAAASNYNLFEYGAVKQQQDNGHSNSMRKSGSGCLYGYKYSCGNLSSKEWSPYRLLMFM